MNKIAYFRKLVREKYEMRAFPDAAAIGEALITEHRITNAASGAAYADDLFNLARVYDEMGAAERATSLYMESVNKIVAEQGDTAPLVIRLNNLGAMLNKRGSADAAYRVFLHAAVITRGAEATDESKTADALYNLANAAADAGRREEARNLHKEALSIRERIGAPNADLVHSLHSLAFLFEDAETIEQAIAYADAAKAKALGTDEYFGACYYLAELLSAGRKHAEARPLYEAVLDWIEGEGGTGHSAYINAATRLAHSIAGAGEEREALSIMNSVLETLEKRLNGDYLCKAGCLWNLAALHRKLGEPEEAARLAYGSMMIKARLIGPGSRETLADAMLLTEIYFESGLLDKAVETLVYILMHSDFADAKESAQKMLGMLGRSGSKNLSEFARLLEKLDDPAELSRIMDIWRQNDGV